MTLPIEINIDASSLSSSGCMLQWTRKIVDGYRSPVNSADMVYGIAIHKFIDTMFKTKGNMAAARDAAYKSFRVTKFDKPKKLHMSDERHMLTTCITYWQDYIQKDEKFEILQLPNGDPATELTFRFLYYEDEFIKVYLCGTIDKIGKFKGGCYAVGDYKTTSSWDEGSYFKQYEMSCQLRFYVHALQWMSEHEPQSILGQVGKNCGAFIDALFIKTKVVENLYERSEVFQFKQEHLAEFRELLNSKIQELSFHASRQTRGAIRPPKQGILTGACEKKFGRCEFWSACRNQDDKIMNLVLERDFIRKPFNPLKYNED